MTAVMLVNYRLKVNGKLWFIISLVLQISFHMTFYHHTIHKFDVFYVHPCNTNCLHSVTTAFYSDCKG